jgi:hypothetical protein
VIAAAALSKIGYTGMGIGGAAFVVGIVTAVVLGLRSQRAFNGFVTHFQARYPNPPDGVPDRPRDWFKNM